MRTIKLQAIPLSDDNGGRSFNFSIDDLKELVNITNIRFRCANIKFDFDSKTDWKPIQNTSLNNMTNSGNNWWVKGNLEASKYPGKIVVFFRHGTGSSPTWNGHAYPPNIGLAIPPSQPLPTDNVNYVAMPNTLNGIRQSDNFFAHELGHYLGLFHTFPGFGNGHVYGSDPNNLSPEDAKKALAEYIRNNGGNESAMNGDLLTDTPNDPGLIIYRANNWSRCDAANSTILIDGTYEDNSPYSYTFSPPLNNIMAYGACGDKLAEFTRQQINRINKTLKHTSRRSLLNPPCYKDFHNLNLNKFQYCFNYWVNRGFWPTTLSINTIGPRFYVAGSFQKSDGAPCHHLLSNSEYQRAFVKYRARGFRPKRVHVIATNSGPRFTVIWTPIRESFEARHGITLRDFGLKFADMRSKGYILSDLFIYKGKTGPLAAAIWEKKHSEGNAAYYGMTSNEYNMRFRKFWNSGFRVTRFVAYKVGARYYYAAIWDKLPGRWAHYYGLSSSQYQSKYNTNISKGLILHQVQSYGNRFSAIWTDQISLNPD